MSTFSFILRIYTSYIHKIMGKKKIKEIKSKCLLLQNGTQNINITIFVFSYAAVTQLKFIHEAVL